jgi:hypothetical protein
MTDREDAWAEVHESMPAKWRLGLPSRDVRTGTWIVSAYERGHGRLAKPVTVTGTGATETEPV